jgi:hypothetical protein
MNWKLIIKDPHNQPAQGIYSDWKEQVAKECYFQCVYCSIHESQFGGVNNFQIDHYRPRSKFQKLENDICNLFYACPICNRFKSNDWPNEPDINTISYPDPSKIDFCELFEIGDNFEINGKYNSSKYLVVRLFLNRAQLILERRETIRLIKVTELTEDLTNLIDRACYLDTQVAIDAYRTFSHILKKIQELKVRKMVIRPYALVDIRKR